jgi:hypothetical protein
MRQFEPCWHVRTAIAIFAAYAKGSKKTSISIVIILNLCKMYRNVKQLKSYTFNVKCSIMCPTRALYFQKPILGGQSRTLNWSSHDQNLLFRDRLSCSFNYVRFHKGTLRVWFSSIHCIMSCAYGFQSVSCIWMCDKVVFSNPQSRYCCT